MTASKLMDGFYRLQTTHSALHLNHPNGSYPVGNHSDASARPTCPDIPSLCVSAVVRLHGRYSSKVETKGSVPLKRDNGKDSRLERADAAY
jgi:hypothetical protein